MAAIQTTIEGAVFAILSVTNIEVKLQLALASIREVPRVLLTVSGKSSPIAKAWKDESALQFIST